MNDRIKFLYQRYCENRSTQAEWEELMAYMDKQENEEQIGLLMDETWDQLKEDPGASDIRRLENLKRHILTKPIAKKQGRMHWYALLAAVLCGALIGIYFLQVHHLSLREESAQILAAMPDVPAGDNKAVIIFDDGREIDLEAMEDGDVLPIDNMQVKKMGKGWVRYEQANSVGKKDMVAPKRCIIRTPRGGEYRITLPDGSAVLLNALSSLTLPSYFSENERRVALIGEAYFDVKHKNGKGKLQSPFIVHTANQDIQVLGTSFNVQAYPDQAEHYTTLLEGAVKISTGAEQQDRKYLILKPGQQAGVTDRGRHIQVKTVDLEEITAWKDGFFLFNNESLQKIMQQIERWYDVDVEYTGDTKKLRFFGIYDRSKSLKSLLNNLEQTGKIRFEILSNHTKQQERRVIVKVYSI